MLRYVCLLLPAVLVAGCSKDEPLPVVMVGPDANVLILPEAGPPPDAGTPDAGRPDLGVPDAGAQDSGPPPPPPGVRVNGATVDLEAHFAGRTQPVQGMEVRAFGVTPASMATSSAAGEYSLDVPQNGKVVLNARRNGYRSTYQEISVAAVAIDDQKLYVASDAQVNAIATAHAVNVLAAFACHAPNPTNLSCRYAMIAGRVVDDGSADNGTPTPLAGVSAGDFTIKGEGDPAWEKKGPYFLSPDGTPSPAITTSQRVRDPATQKYRGGWWVVFVEVPITGNPPRSFEISASSLAGGNQVRHFGPIQVKAYNGGLTWVTLAETGRGPPPVNPPPPPPNGADFDTQIYPLFLTVPEGGLGCQGCHTNQGGAVPAAGMNLTGGPEVAYASLDPARYPQRVNTQNPAASYLLVRPLYEANGDQDHPIFAFASIDDPAYRLIEAWIRAGAQRVGGPVVQPVSFRNEIVPLLTSPAAPGIGCYGCHVAGVDANTAPARFYMGGDPAALHRAITQEPATDSSGTGERYRINKQGQTARSLLLLNPLTGSPEPHPAKLLTGTDDPRYQVLYRWIAQGYVLD